MNNWAYAVKAGRGSNEGQTSIAVSGTSGVTVNPIGKTTCVVYSTVECFIVAGETPTATVAVGTPIPAFTLVPVKGLGINDKIAAITTGASGTLYIRPNA